MTDMTTGDVIHRLKNHIAIIVGFCELVVGDTPDTDPRRADLLEIQKAAHDAMAQLPEVTRRAEGGGHHV
jgi:hypothetical protein